MRTVIRWGALIIALVVAGNFLLPLAGIPMPYYSCGYNDSGFLTCRVRWN